MNKYGSARIERKKFWDRMRIYGYCAGVLLVIILVLYVVIGSPIFRITDVVVESPTEIDNELVIRTVKGQVQAAGGLLGSDNYFAWSSGAGYAAPNVSSIIVEKGLFNKTVTLKVEPRQRFAVWCSNNSDAEVGAECFWVDQAGLLFEQAPATEGQLVLSVHDDASAAQLTLGKPVLDSEQFIAVSKIFKSEIMKEIGIRSVKLSRSLQQLEATTNGGTKLLFSVRFDPEPSALPALAKFKETPGLSKLEYVNLTVENRAFVKYR